jgi:predicted O-methyltransferase YrrM
MPGQITLDTEFGKRLKALGTDPSYSVFVDIGTWDGQGTTLCIAEGLRERADLSGCAIVSVEASRTWHRVAAAYWREKGLPIYCLWGRIGEHMMTDREVLEHPLYDKIKEHYALHYTQDVKDFVEAPLIRLRRCDVAVLDGGEFAGYGDWEQIKKLNPKVIALDDIHSMKNDKVLDEICSQADEWNCEFISAERNGCAILRRRALAIAEREAAQQPRLSF